MRVRSSQQEGQQGHQRGQHQGHCGGNSAALGRRGGAVASDQQGVASGGDLSTAGQGCKRVAQGEVRCLNWQVSMPLASDSITRLSSCKHYDAAIGLGGQWVHANATSCEAMVKVSTRDEAD
jgi:hypothetical protein